MADSGSVSDSEAIEDSRVAWDVLVLDLRLLTTGISTGHGGHGSSSSDEGQILFESPDFESSASNPTLTAC